MYRPFMYFGYKRVQMSRYYNYKGATVRPTALQSDSLLQWTID